MKTQALVNIQNDYFAGGAMALVKMDTAAENEGHLPRELREQRLPVFRIQHISVRSGEASQVHGAFMAALSVPYR